jgi:cysteine-rich repeat protein
MVLLWGISTQLVACEDSPSTRTVQSFEGAETPLGDAADYGPDFCRDRADGEVCGVDRHCIDSRCHFNTCGDAIEAGDEQCDDGNELHGDGCTPSCRLELMQCDDDRWLAVGDDCDTGQDDEPEAGSVDDFYREDCPRVIRTTIEPRTRIPVGETAELSVRIEGMGDVLWMSTADGEATASSELFSSPRSLNTQFTCLEPRSYTIILMTSTPRCRYPRTKEIRFHCELPLDPGTDPADAGGHPPDVGLPDAGPNAGPIDAGPPPLDAGPGPDAAPDAGPLDAGHQPDAQPPDAGATTRFRSAACETCVRAACVDYSSIDFIGPCFGGTLSPDFSQRCSDLFFCSHLSPDNCAYNTERGPVGCFCGENVSVDACQQGTVQGNCVPEWYAAAECPPGDHLCVLEKFIDLTLPSGYANFLIECQNMACTVECTP